VVLPSITSSTSSAATPTSSLLAEEHAQAD
jgi:hypothetical protein